MLKDLHIQNFAIIQDVSVSFEEGMTVLTGETGAGKSIIIDAVSLIVGGRGSADYIRHGAKKCQMEAEFYLEKYPQDLMDILDREAIDHDYNELLIQRDIYQNGRNVCRVNGAVVTISLLKEIGQYLIDIHGQNEHQALMNPQEHLHLLDQFGGKKLAHLKAQYAAIYKKYQSLIKEQKRIYDDEQFALQKMDFLKHQRQELQEARLDVEEEKVLEQEKKYLVNYQTISQSLEGTHYYLSGADQTAINSIGQAINELEKIADVDEKYADWLERMNDVFYLLQDLDAEISDYSSHLEYDENRLDEILTRIEQLTMLKRKYGMSIQELIIHAQEISQEIEAIENREAIKTHLEEDIANYKEELKMIGRSLSDMRKEIARKLEKEVRKQLSDLFMPSAQFIVSMQEREFGMEGTDEIQFYLTTNIGEPAKPLAKIASGGEMSRMMLALKTIFTQISSVGTVIFDEIDTGVSGRVAQAIASKMQSVAQHSQVLAVTHLPQVAAAADYHLSIQKKLTTDERTQTEVIKLSEDERVEEVARMLSGSEMTEATKIAAQELLDRKNSSHHDT